MLLIFCLRQGKVFASFESFLCFLKLLVENRKLLISATLHFKYLDKHFILVAWLSLMFRDYHPQFLTCISASICCGAKPLWTYWFDFPLLIQGVGHYNVIHLIFLLLLSWVCVTCRFQGAEVVLVGWVVSGSQEPLECCVYKGNMYIFRALC